MDRRVFSCALAVAAALFAHAAGAQNLLCTGAVEDRRVNGNLTAVGVCELDDVEVRGNVRVPDGASLFASDVRIGGNLIVDRALAVDVSSSEINGNLTVEELAGFESEVTGTEVGGNVVLERNRTRVNLVGNEIRGKVTVVLNTGGVELTANTIGGRLECERNDPAPLVFENVVDDGARGQCASLSPPPSPSPEPAPPTQPPQQPPVTPGPPSPAPSPSPSPIPSPSPSPAPPSVPETTSSFVPQPEGGGGGAVGALEIGLLPLLLLGRLRRRFGPYGRRAAG